VYSLNPALTEMVAKQRAAELSRQSRHSDRPRPTMGRLGSFKKATGWALVEIGLRLALPRPGLIRPRPPVSEAGGVGGPAPVRVAN
jgi:hypothetical protein